MTITYILLLLCDIVFGTATALILHAMDSWHERSLTRELIVLQIVLLIPMLLKMLFAPSDLTIGIRFHIDADINACIATLTAATAMSATIFLLTKERREKLYLSNHVAAVFVGLDTALLVAALAIRTVWVLSA